MIDKIKSYFEKRRQAKIAANIDGWMSTQIMSLNPNSKGVIIFKYGLPEYMVSGSAAKKVIDTIEPIIKNQFPNYSIVLIPFYVTSITILNDTMEETK